MSNVLCHALFFIILGMKNRNYLQSLLTQLNRCIVLQCPHLAIPWLGGDCLLDQPRTGKREIYMKKFV